MNWYKTAQLQEISPQQAFDQKLFGPVYHGTSGHLIDNIKEKGFQFEENEAQQGNTSHGYPVKDYRGGIPAPVHHLGYGVYFTTNKSIAKQFGNDSLRNVIKDIYLSVPRLETINFGAPKKMMSWWISHGYDPTLAKRDRVAATKQMTQNLASQFDAVWFKGKSMYRLLDGDQVCVYQPQNKVFVVNKKLAKPGEIGGSVIRKQDGMKGRITRPPRQILDEYRQHHPPEANSMYGVKWQKGGEDYNVYDHEIDHV